MNQNADGLDGDSSTRKYRRLIIPRVALAVVLALLALYAVITRV